MPNFDFTDLEDELLSQAGVDDSVSPAPDTSAVPTAMPEAQPQPQSSLGSDPAVYAARENRDKDVASANLAQGISQIGASLASQGRVHADPAVFDSVRKEAETTAQEADKDAQLRRKTVVDFMKAKAQLAKDKANLDFRQERAGATDEWRKKIGERGDERLNNTQLRTANMLLNSPNAKKEMFKLTAASGARALVDDIKAGHIKDSSNIAKQLTNLIATIEMGGPGASADREAMGVNTLYTKVQGALSWIEGNPKSSIPSDYLNQISAEVDALGNRAAKNYKAITDSDIAGADMSALDPEADPGKVNALARNKQKMFLSQMGFNPVTGERSAAAPPAPSNPAAAPSGPKEVERKTKDGKIGIYDSATKQFLRWKL